MDKSFQIILTIYIEMAMLNNENKLSKNAKRRNKRKESLNNELNNLLNAVKQAKRKKNFDKIKELEIK